MRKPQLEIFYLAANSLQVYLEDAQAIGMAGMQFSNNRQAILEIQRYLDVHS